MSYTYHARAISRIEILVLVVAVASSIAFGIWFWSRAREEARAKQCMAILQRYGKVFTRYTDDHQGVLPYENVGDESLGHIPWYDALEPYREPGQWICPSVDRTVQNHLEAYRLNSKLARPGATPPQPYRSLDSIDQRDATVILFDAEYGGKALSLKGKFKDADFRHNASLNMLFADWHVERLTEKELTDATNWLPPKIIWDPDIGKQAHTKSNEID
ncbi:MAG: hypothetical protein MI923_30570 [Phycisphaerales bacterium]|nr:hypothetical protein [Phycisphaerales bacterium]